MFQVELRTTKAKSLANKSEQLNFTLNFIARKLRDKVTKGYITKGQVTAMCDMRSKAWVIEIHKSPVSENQ